MKNFMPGGKWLVLLLSGGFLLAGSGEAWAWDCRTRTVTRREHRRAVYVVHPYVRVDCDVDYHKPRRVYQTQQVVQVIQDDTVIVNVPNDNGSYTPVTLRRSGGGYIGPRGEYYITMPTVEQLKAVYGLK